jgi:hypothetical protein
MIRWCDIVNLGDQIHELPVWGIGVGDDKNSAVLDFISGFYDPGEDRRLGDRIVAISAPD